MLHAPQWLLLELRETHASPQHDSPMAHRAQALSATQRPDWQICPAAQAFPQAPQWLALDWGSTHAPLQQLEPAAHAGPAPHRA